MRNYFKTSKGHTVFFNDNIPESIETAWRAAQGIDGDWVGISIYRPVPIAGDWDDCPIIGHRSRHSILAEMFMATDPEELQLLAGELAQINDAWTAVGRSAPLAAVAA